MLSATLPFGGSLLTEIPKIQRLQKLAVLNYPTVQIRILPLLATTFALHYTGEAMYKLYYGTRAEIEKSGDFSRLAEMHAASSGLKSLSTMLAADGIETCRRAMGGHGFGGGSGMIPLNNDYLSKPTVEGDNWMITQQTASYLIKRMTEVVNQVGTSQHKEPIDFQYQAYFKFLRSRVRSDFFKNDFALVAVSAIVHPISPTKPTKTASSTRKPWTEMMISLHNLSRAHSQQLLVSSFYDGVYTSNPNLDAPTQTLMKTLFRLFALYTLDASASEFLLANAITTDQLKAVQPRIQQLMAEIRPHAVRLVDAWSIPDYLLESSLGRWDGDVYNDLLGRRIRRIR